MNIFSHFNEEFALFHIIIFHLKMKGADADWKFNKICGGEGELNYKLQNITVIFIACLLI